MRYKLSSALIILYLTPVPFPLQNDVQMNRTGPGKKVILSCQKMNCPGKHLDVGCTIASFRVSKELT